MFCSRRLLRVSWTERWTNLSILEELNVELSLVKYIAKRKLKISDTSKEVVALPKHYHKREIQQRETDRQRMRLIDNTEARIGKPINECVRIAIDRRSGERSVELLQSSTLRTEDDTHTRTI